MHRVAARDRGSAHEGIAERGGSRRPDAALPQLGEDACRVAGERVTAPRRAQIDLRRAQPRRDREAHGVALVVGAQLGLVGQVGGGRALEREPRRLDQIATDHQVLAGEPERARRLGQRVTRLLRRAAELEVARELHQARLDHRIVGRNRGGTGAEQDVVVARRRRARRGGAREGQHGPGRRPRDR